MAHTDAHAPYHTRLYRAPVEEHDHRKGPCDLPALHVVAKLMKGADWKALRAYHCSWRVDWLDLLDHSMCNCDKCSGFDEVWNTIRGRSRVAAKKQIRAGAKEYAEDVNFEAFICEDCGECDGWQCRGDANFWRTDDVAEYLAQQVPESVGPNIRWSQLR